LHLIIKLRHLNIHSQANLPSDPPNMQLVNFTALSLFASSALAASCFGNQQKGIDQFQDAFWDARAKMCGNSGCGYQQSCTTQSSKTINGLIKLTVNVSLERKNTGNKKGFKDCWVRGLL
jgi:hypothetical protein